MARRLALIAHDNRKVDFVAWATFNRDTLSQFDLIATCHTARLIRDKVGLEVVELLSGPEGATRRSRRGWPREPSTSCSSSWIRCGPSPTIRMSVRSSGCATCTTFPSRPTSARRI